MKKYQNSYSIDKEKLKYIEEKRQIIGIKSIISKMRKPIKKIKVKASDGSEEEEYFPEDSSPKCDRKAVKREEGFCKNPSKYHMKQEKLLMEEEMMNE